MNKRELRKAIRDRNGIPDTGDGLAGHTDIDDAIRAALHDLSAEKRWPWLLASATVNFSTTTGDATDPPTYSSIREVVINGRPALRATLDDFVGGVSGHVWTDIGNTIRLSPVPTQALTGTVWYYFLEPDLATDIAVPLLPPVHHQTLVARASYHLNARRGRNAEIARDDAEFQRGLSNMMQDIARVSGPRRVRSAYRPKQAPARWA